MRFQEKFQLAIHNYILVNRNDFTLEKNVRKALRKSRQSDGVIYNTYRNFLTGNLHVRISFLTKKLKRRKVWEHVIAADILR